MPSHCPFPGGLCPPWKLEVCLIWGWEWGVGAVLLTHMVAYFSPPSPRPSSCVQKGRLGKRESHSLCLPFAHCLLKRRKEGSREGGSRWWRFLVDAQNGSSGLLGADWEEEGLFLFLPLTQFIHCFPLPWLFPSPSSLLPASPRLLSFGSQAPHVAGWHFPLPLDPHGKAVSDSRAPSSW